MVYCFYIIIQKTRDFSMGLPAQSWIIEETGLETIDHVQCIVHADWLRAFFNMVEPGGNL